MYKQGFYQQWDCSKAHTALQVRALISVNDTYLLPAIAQHVSKRMCP